MSLSTFTVHPDNSRCFLYRGKPFKLLTSAEHYGAVINGDFDLDVYLREMQRTGQNGTRVFTFYRETPECIPAPGAMNTLAPRPDAAVLPWERVPGHGTAADGLEKFDLTRWNPGYFARLKEYVAKCADHGVVCEIVLFCNPYDARKFALWPCSPASNVNGVGADLADPRDFMTLKAPSIVAFQETLVRKLAAELNPYDNVYYEICNEPRVGSNTPLGAKTAPRGGPYPIRRDTMEEGEREVVAWHAHIARTLRRAEEGLPKRHLIAANAHGHLRLLAAPGEVEHSTRSKDGSSWGPLSHPPGMRHEDGAYFENPDIDIVNYHYISAHADARGLRFTRLPSDQARAGLIWHFLRERDAYRKPIVFDETFSGIVRGTPERYTVNRAEAWEMLLSGGAGYSNLDWSFTPADETGSGQEPIADGRRLDGRCLREWLALLRGVLEQYDLASLHPAIGMLPDAVPGYGYAASTDGAGRCILYLVDERVYRLEPCEPRALELTLRLPAGRYAARTFDPRTGATADLPPLQSDGTARLALPPFAEDVAVLLAS